MQYNLPLKTTDLPVTVATKNCQWHNIHTSAISYCIRELDISHLYEAQSSIEKHCVPVSGLCWLLENFPWHTIHTSAISCSISELDISHLYEAQSSL